MLQRDSGFTTVTDPKPEGSEGERKIGGNRKPIRLTKTGFG